MDEIIHIDGLPVKVEHHEGIVRLTFDTLTADEVDRVLKHLEKINGEEIKQIEANTIEELAEMTFNDVLIRIVHK